LFFGVSHCFAILRDPCHRAIMDVGIFMAHTAVWGMFFGCNCAYAAIFP